MNIMKKRIISLSLFIFLSIFVLNFTCKLSKAETEKSVPNSAEMVNPLNIGDVIPQIVLKNPDKTDFDLNKSINKTPAVIIFYRGSW